MTPPRPYICYCPFCGCPGILWMRTGNSFGAWLYTDGWYAGAMLPKAKVLHIHPDCKHYIWNHELIYEIPKNLKLKAFKVSKSNVKVCNPHPIYLGLLENPFILEILNNTNLLWDVFVDLKRNPIERLKNLLRLFLNLKKNPLLELKDVINPESWETAWQLGVAGPDAEIQRLLLRNWWWSIHHLKGKWNKQDKYIPPLRYNESLVRCLNQFLPLLTEVKHLIDRAEVLRELGQFEAAGKVYQAIDASVFDEYDGLRFPLIGQLINMARSDLDAINLFDNKMIF